MCATHENDVRSLQENFCRKVAQQDVGKKIGRVEEGRRLRRVFQ
jgi:hypothetical protein